jgi:hypothetical protein
MRFLAVLLLAATPLLAQTGEAVLARLNGVAWEQAPAANCEPHIPAQLEVYATVEWTRHCSDTRGEIVRESYFYAFGEPAREARLRVDLRPVDESAATASRLLNELRAELDRRFGAATHEPAMMELGFRVLRYGQPVAGDHWRGGGLHYFLHANQTNLTPMGMRRGVQLIVMNDRLVEERARDAEILRVEGIYGEVREEDNPVRLRLMARIGPPFIRAMRASGTQTTDPPRFVRETVQDLIAILREADVSSPPRRALCLLAADLVVNKLSLWLVEPSPQGERESSAANQVRRELMRYGVRLGGMTHAGGLAYNRELLWNVWRESPDTEAGELAFLELQARGWTTDSGEGCPANPDLFRTVIERGEDFLARHPRSDFRVEVLFALAQANESWWSIGHAPKDDPWVGAPPYPRRIENVNTAEAARARAIRYYREVVASAPNTLRAATAIRRLPRLVLGLDTGQRVFFCSYC